MKHLLVNVPGKNGYSFMVHGDYDENHESEIIDACLKNDLFQDAEDANYCTIVEADENDIKAFGTVGEIHEI